MEILNLIQCLNLGGMEQSSYILMKNTQGQGIYWQVQSITPAGVGKEILTNTNIPVFDNPYKGKFGYKSHLSLRDKVSNFSGDIILVTGATLTGCLSVKFVPCKKVLAIHFCHKFGFLNLLKWRIFYKIFQNDYQAIIYSSPYILEEAKKIAPYLQHKFYLIENSIERCSNTTDTERDIARTNLGIATNVFVIGNAGWLIDRKRFDVFLEVCAQVSNYTPNFLFLIAGNGPLRYELEKLAAKLGIDNKVKWIGWQKDLSDFYKSLDLLLFNSNSDAFGRTILEAMSYGIPVVASVIEGGADSIIVHEENGYLIREHDIDKLAKLSLNLIKNKDLYFQFKTRSLDIVKDRFNTEKFTKKYLEIFEKIANESNKY